MVKLHSDSTLFYKYSLGLHLTDLLIWNFLIDLKNAKVHLMLKTSKKQEVTRFHESLTLDTELAREYRFDIAIDKPR